MQSEQLIGQLSQDLPPVRRLPGPVVLTVLWLALAFAAIGAAVLYFGPRHDLVQRLDVPFDWQQAVASTLTGIAAALAAAMLALPDRDWRWGLLPVLPLVAWFGSLTMGCISDVQRLGMSALELTTSWGCVKIILGLGLPLTAVMLLLLRHAGLVRPVPVILMGGLSAASLASAGLTLFHHLEAAAMVLVWHGGAILLLVCLGTLLGRRLLLRLPG